MSNEIAAEEKALEVTLEEQVRFAMMDLIDCLKQELSHAKQREMYLQKRLDELVDRLGTKSRWW